MTTITWIPVTERLPDADTTVLVALDNGDTLQGFLDGVVWRDATAWPIELAAYRVTHWADMPEPPR